MKLLGMQEEGTPSRIARMAPVTIILGSLMTLIPGIAVVPFLPPCGLLMLLGWRLLRADALPVWAAAPLGLFDDLVSGQPMGSATLLWALCVLSIDVIDTRLVSRDFWQDWLIAGGAIVACLAAGRVFASTLDAHVDTVLLLQMVTAIALFPLATRICVWIEGREEE